MTPEEIIKLFDKKINRLQASSLIRFMSDSGWKFSFDFTKNTLSPDAVLPDLEFIESYVLNLRFFIQNNEPTSLCNLDKTYKNYCKDKEHYKKFSELRKVFNSELDKVWPFRFNKQQITYRDIFMGFIYSEIAHSNVDSHQIFYDMTKHPFGYYLAFNTFLNCINFVHDILVMINRLNKIALTA